MKRDLSIWFFLSLLAGTALVFQAQAAEREKPSIYYVQLIRCSDEDKAPEPGCRRVGPKLAERFKCVFRCKSYWEISQEKIEVLPSKTARVHLSNGRVVEIDLSQSGKRSVAAFHQGRLIDRTIEPISENMTLIGGDRDQASHWFIVVRRDKPAS